MTKRVNKYKCKQRENKIYCTDGTAWVDATADCCLVRRDGLC